MRTARLRPSFYGLSQPRQLSFLEQYAPQRGDFDEILAPVLPPALWEDARLPESSELCAAILIVRQLVAVGRLPADDVGWLDDGTGHSVGVELYGFGEGLVLVQTRDVRVPQPYAPAIQRIEYWVTDGESLREVPARPIRPACARDPAPISALMAVRKHLPVLWTDRLPPVPMVVKRAGGTAVPAGSKPVKSRRR